MLPGGVIIGVLHSAGLVYGANVLALVFGVEQAEEIIRPEVRNGLGAKLSRVLGRDMRLWSPFFGIPGVGVGIGKGISWGAWLGLPLIAPVLVTMRLGRWGDWVGGLLPLIVSMTWS